MSANTLRWNTPAVMRRVDELVLDCPEKPVGGRWGWVRSQLTLPAAVTANALRLAYADWRRRAPALPESPSGPEQDEQEFRQEAPQPLSEAEMVALFHVDLTRWQVVALEHRAYHMGAKGPDELIVTQPMYVTRIRCKPLPGAASLTALAEGLIADIRGAGASRPRLKPKAVTGADHLLELAPMDLHIGKLSWPAETGEIYDIDHAEAAFTGAFEDLLTQTAALSVEEIVIPVGNDLLHIDNLEATTTSGTRMDADSRYAKIFRAARALMAWAAERAVRVAPVRMVVVPGNHDRLGAFHVGEVLAAQFADHRFITIDNGPELRKFHHYGRTLLGFTHGSEEKMADLPLIMADRPEWGQTTCREWHIGHFHKRQETRFTAGDSFHGVIVRVLPSLSAADAWHYKKGYVGNRRAMEAYWYHREDGFRGYAQSRVAA